MRGFIAVLALTVVACTEPSAQRARSGAGRVVSLHDVTTEMVVALGATPRLVGVGETVDVTPDVAAQIRHVPRVGALESILAVSPDVVLGLVVLAEREPELILALKRAGIDVHLADPARLEDVFSVTRAVAARLRLPARAEPLVHGLRARLAGLPPPPARRPRVFVYDCCDPPFTAGAKTVLTDLIARAGARNVFADLNADWTHVSWEDVIARRPELILIHAYQHDGQADVAGKRRTLAGIPSLARVPVAVLPLGLSLGGIRSIEGLCRIRAAARELS